MWIPFTVLTLLAQTVLGDSSIIQLNTGNTIQDFLNQALVSTLGLQSTQDNVIEFGDFKAYVGDFESAFLEQLKNDPIIQAIFPNELINPIQFNDRTSQDSEIKPGDGTTTLEPKASATTAPSNPSESVQGYYNSTGSTNDTQSQGLLNGNLYVQKNAPRHLIRLSQREGLFINNTLNQPPTDYYYDTLAEDITAYVLDTGIAVDHPEFGGRASHGANFADDTDGDSTGHGTNVAGIIGSKTYGVAKNISIVDVKVLGSNGGSTESILRGFEWATKNYQNGTGHAVLNYSVGGPKSDAINNAISAAVNEGLVVFAAAGNANNNASDYTPGSAKDAILVGALDDRSDTIALYSNWGPAVDVFASGVAVESLNSADFSTSIKYYGTSQASPIVAGLGALLLQKGTEPSGILDEIIDLSTKNAISQETYDNNSNYTDTVNRVAYNGAYPTLFDNDYISNPSTQSQDQTLRNFVES